MTSLRSKVDQMASTFAAEVVKAIRERLHSSTISQLAGEVQGQGIAPQPPTEVTEVDGRFTLTLPDGRQLFASRKRDLLRRARLLNESLRA